MYGHPEIEISLQVLKWSNIFQHEKRNFVSASSHVAVMQLYLICIKHQWNEKWEMKQRLLNLPVHFCSFTIKFWNGYFRSSCRICNGNLTKVKESNNYLQHDFGTIYLSHSLKESSLGVTIRGKNNKELVKTFLTVEHCFSWTKSSFSKCLKLSFSSTLGGKMDNSN